MDPFTIIFALFGMGMNAAGSLGKAKALKEESEYNAAVAESNAQVARQAQGDALLRGNAEEGAARMKGSADIGEMRAAYGASGVDGSIGSPLHAMADARMINELDAQTIKNNAAREAWGYQVQESNYTREAKMQKKRGENAVTSTLLGGAGDLFAGGTSMYAKSKGG